VITGEQLEQIQFEHSGVVYFPFHDEFKLSAAWLIEQCGWKNRRQGEVGTYSGQPLVLVNYGLATGKDILDFANQIRESVYEKFGINLETEVNIV
jgi:UDP-N-acetylmuramate dehydrogenase